MSIPKDKPSAQDQYNTILKGLEEKHRVGYDTKNHVFVDLSREKGDDYKNTPNTKSDLKTIKKEVQTFIKKNEVFFEDPQKTKDLIKAFKARAKELKGRSLFLGIGSGKRDAAVERLNTFTDVIYNAALDILSSAKKIPQNEPQAPVKEELSQNKIEEKQEKANIQEKTTKNILDSSSPKKMPPKEKEEKNTNLISDQKPIEETSNIFSSAPPPPSNVPPPPSFTNSAAGPTFTHKAVTTESDKLAKFENEPIRPQIDPKHDLGKPKEISREQREKYANEAETYVEGAPQEGIKKMGMKTQTVITRQPNGLKHILAPLSEIITKNSKDLEQLEGKKIQSSGLERQIETLEKRIKKMTTFNERGEDYVLYTKGEKKGEKGKPINLVSDSKYQKQFLEPYNQRSNEEKTKLQKKDGVFPKERTIGNQILLTRKRVNRLKEDLKEITSEIKNIEERIAKREELQNNKIPFNQWSLLVEKKGEIGESWLKIAANLKKGSAPVEKEKTATELEDEQLMEKIPLAKDQVEFVQGLSQTKQIQYNSNPNAFFDDLVDEGGV